MKFHIATKEHIAFGSNFESYFDQKHPPDCSLFSQDNYEFQVHKEILFQTKYLRKMVKSLNTDSCKGNIKFKFRVIIRPSSLAIINLVSKFIMFCFITMYLYET